MPRPKRIPKRLPPDTKEFQKLLKQLNGFVGIMASYEKDSIQLSNARQAITPETEPRQPKEKKTEGANDDTTSNNSGQST